MLTDPGFEDKGEYEKFTISLANKKAVLIPLMVSFF